MDMINYFRSVTNEMRAIQDRVRHFISSAHWPSDGDWKESIVRSMLRRSLPKMLGLAMALLSRPTARPSRSTLFSMITTSPSSFKTATS